MKKTFTFITTFVALLVVALFLVMNSGTTVSAQETNLLVNPGFNDPYAAFTPIFGYQQSACAAGVCTTAQMPAGWLPWWVPQTSSDDEFTNRMPEFKPVCPFSPCPYPDRVQGGSQAAQYFTFWSKHTGGMYQTVTVPNNATLKFSVYGQAWSTSSDSAKSDGPTQMNMKIGIDPTGGSDPFSANIVWSAPSDPYDAYRLFEIVAQAQGDKVTVFMYSSPQEPRKHNDVYWDEAALVTTDGSAIQTVVDPTTGAVSTVPVNTGVRFAPAGPTPTPNAAGVIEVAVQSGDTLWSIAARAGMSLDDVLALNPGLTRNSLLGWGDRIILGYAGGAQGGSGGGGAESAAAEEAAVEASEASAEETSSEETAETAEATGEEAAGETEVVEVAEVEPTPVPEPTATMAPAGGAICLLAFDDSNGDGSYGAGESLRASVAFTIAKDQAVVSNYITDGVNEPFCIEGLDAGNYRISRSFTENEVATNGSDWGASIVDGSRQQFDFGSRIEEPAMEVADTSAADTSAADSSVADSTAADSSSQDAGAGAVTEGEADADGGGGLTSWLVWIILAIAVILIVGVALVIMSARRATID